jgi:hypothetical protein
MARQPEKQARAEAMLGELAELGLMVAKELAVRLRECEDTQETVALAAAFQKMSRVVRLTLALDFKLERDAAREDRAEAQEAATAARLAENDDDDLYADDDADDPVAQRQRRVSGLANRLIWNESEGDETEYEMLREDLTARLDEAALSPDFLTLPIETLTRRLIADMGLSGELKLSVCEQAGPQANGSASPERRSSA